MRREFFTRKSVLLLLATIIFTTFLLSRDQWTEDDVVHGTAIGGRVSDLKRSLTCQQSSCSTPHKEGKQILYQALTNCSQPEFLSNRKNPCWKSTHPEMKVICSAKIVLLGFHKSGTTDVSRWFKKVSAYTTSDYFITDQMLTKQCPVDWLEAFRLKRRLLKDVKMIAYDDCPGCAIVGRVIQENSTYIIRQSAIQYLQYTMIEESRYVVTMRDPADRMISHFFYVHKIKRPDNPYINRTAEELGYSYFHKLVSDTTSSLTTCLKHYGTTVCVLEKELSPLTHPNPYLLSMMTIGCYSTHLKEVLKFIPKEKIYFSKLEEYSKDEAESMRKIYNFAGIAITEANDPAKSAQKNVVRNAGLESKPVLPETKELLRIFYQPFNVELTRMLGNDKWLWL